MRGDFLQHGLSQAVPQVPAIPGLDRAGQCPADRLTVGAGPVPAHDFDARVVRNHASSTPAFRLARTSTRCPVWASVKMVA